MKSPTLTNSGTCTRTHRDDDLTIPPLPLTAACDRLSRHFLLHTPLLTLLTLRDIIDAITGVERRLGRIERALQLQRVG